MSDIKTLEDKIEGELKMPRFTMGATTKILEAKDLKVIERHGSALDTSTKIACSGTVN